jgi:hypothetical protein
VLGSRRGLLTRELLKAGGRCDNLNSIVTF